MFHRTTARRSPSAHTNPLLLSVALFLLAPATSVAQRPRIPMEAHRYLAEAFRIGDALQDSVWAGWSRAPFAVLLITDEYEFLIRHPRATNNFDTLGYDPAFHSLVLYRKRILQTNLLATFPAVNGYSTIVVGLPEATNVVDPTHWIVTLLHEHFHQLQQSQPDYYAATESLAISRGDQSGMWMLNYPFPYDAADVNGRFTSLCSKLLDALTAVDSGDFDVKAREYVRSQSEFRSTLRPDDYKYFSLQVWQEGIARYTEIRVSQCVARYGSRIRPPIGSPASYRALSDSLQSAIIRQLPSLSLTSMKRSAFYVFGAAEGLLLDRMNPGWHDQYFQQKFYLEKLYGQGGGSR